MFDTSFRRGVNGILFKQYVGVITVKDLTIYVLPKADKDANEETDDKTKTLWQDRLIFMLSQVYKLNVQTTAPANLQRKSYVLLNIFLKKFLDEVAILLNRGLVKTYRKTDGNRAALKGKLLFNKQVSYNCVHQERFYVRYTTYDYNHILNRIIRQALLVIHNITNSSDIKGRATSTLFNFPELDEIPVTPELFSRLIFDRKSEDYRNVIKLAEMILLNYSPDLQHGSNHVWTLMFDMNKLWEEFIYITLKRKLTDCTVIAQKQKTLWESDSNRKTVRADIVVEKGKDIFVLDTKWKMPRYDDKIVPSDADLHQMYVYLDIYGNNSNEEAGKKAKKVALLYPGQNITEVKGKFVNKPDNSYAQCDMLFLPGKSYNTSNNGKTEFQDWQEAIAKRIMEWMRPLTTQSTPNPTSVT
jgi:5-methylcytosine-specific restriction enzyme subunit McrC